MNKFSTYWTGAVAYLSLLVGAGLSVAGNLADTYRVRGDLVDAVDIALAVGPPLATLLVAELFVSQWPRQWSLQAVRWGGTITVGTLAMVVSWLHLSELLAARGQTALVAILWPLAIDGLAIMAMAKLLAMRAHGRGQVATVAIPLASGQADIDGPAAMATEVAREMDTRLAGGRRVHAEDMNPWPAATDWDKELAGFDVAIDRAGQDVATAAEAILRPAPVAAVSGVPAEARDLLTAWDNTAVPVADVDALLAAHFGRNPRTIRRWRSIVRPTSA